jgi:hypothetical protein
MCLSVRPYVRPSAWNNSAPIGRIFMKSDLENFSKICRGISSLIKNLKRVARVLHEDLRAFMTLSRLIIL